MKKTLLKISKYALICLLVASTFILSACSSSSAQGGTARPFQIAFCSLYVADDAVQSYGESLTQQIPGLNKDGSAPLFTTLIMGELESSNPGEEFVDLTYGMGGMMQFTTMMAAGELDIMIGDLTNAERYGAAEYFIPLDELFTEEELAGLDQSSFISFEKKDTYGEPTGEFTASCGIDISANAEMKPLFGEQQLGVFVLTGCSDRELAKQVVLALIA